ncbi:MAG TPA: SCO family protein [Blastocatellia bacterium]|nr:SCO family protein [Blastocatellia bacterium]
MKTKIMPRTHQFRHPLLLWGATAFCLFLFGPFVSSAGARPRQDQTTQTHDHHKQPGAQDKATREETVKLSIPDLSLLDQQGRKISFYSDLVKGKTVAINFIFTTCTTICPPLGATFAKTQKLLGDRLGKDVFLISITVDPVTDTPERLRAWGEKFGAKQGWTFVTGEKAEMDKLLKALNGYTARIEDHSPMILIGDDARSIWTRAYGLAPPAKLMSIIETVSAKAQPEESGHGRHQAHQPAQSQQEPSPAQKYFSDVELINQYGEKLRFYSDLLKGKVVVINSFFSACSSICPPMNRNFTRIQEALGDRVGKDVHLISLSVDPETDTPSRLKEYAEKLGAKPGWHLLTGKKENIDQALYKVGHYVEVKDDHTSIVIIGNEPKGVWTKAMGLAKADQLIKLVNEILNEK